MPLPDPVPGLVISYDYVWSAEHDRGTAGARKTRPCVVIVRIERAGERLKVAVSPIPHSPPDARTPALEIPPGVKRHLGLDAGQSWIVLNEINEFAWPGFHLRPVRRGSEALAYGHLPPKLFARIVTRMRDTWRTGAGKIIQRD